MRENLILLFAITVSALVCDPSCSTCLDTTLNGCATCPSGFQLYVYSYGDSGPCVASGSCTTALYTDGSGNLYCMESAICPSTYYLDPSNNCQSRVDNCVQTLYSTGANADPCLSCNGGMYLLVAANDYSGSCTGACSAGQQTIGTSICSPYTVTICNVACNTCSANDNPNFCLTCPANQYLVPKTYSRYNPLGVKVCSSTLPDYTYLSSTNRWTAQVCHPKCSTCIGSTFDSCTSCYGQGKLLVQTFTNGIPKGICTTFTTGYGKSFTFGAITIYFCIFTFLCYLAACPSQLTDGGTTCSTTCDSTCLTCSNPADNTACTQCISPNKFIIVANKDSNPVQGTCGTSCTSDKFVDLTTGFMKCFTGFPCTY